MQAAQNPLNPVFMMATSGARGSIAQVKQLGGMRGLMSDPSGRILEIPVKASLKEGLTVLEYFISTHGARKGLADTALRTADSGYLTRRLVDVAQDVIIREEDCGTTNGITVSDIRVGKEIIEPLIDRIIGRRAAEDIRLDPKRPTTAIVTRDEEIDEEKAKAIIDAGVTEVKIRSVLTCQAKYGVCSMCYGRDFATGKTSTSARRSASSPRNRSANRARSSRCAPSTPAASRPKTSSRVSRASRKSSKRASPRVKRRSSEATGTVQARRGDATSASSTSPTRTAKSTSTTCRTARISWCRTASKIEAGDQLNEGSLNPHDILRIKGETALQNYLVQEVQKVYRSQGVDINDKHIEVIVRSMLRKVKIVDGGDTTMLPGQLVEAAAFHEANERDEGAGKELATANPVLLGVTKASLATESFLSAAIFQETTRVLTDAAIKGKHDPLLGLKENVIIGKLIPAGTGMSRYRNIADRSRRVRTSTKTGVRATSTKYRSPPPR